MAPGAAVEAYHQASGGPDALEHVDEEVIGLSRYRGGVGGVEMGELVIRADLGRRPSHQGRRDG